MQTTPQVTCECGGEVRSFIVKKQGSPNLGREFYTCQGCDAFYWKDVLPQNQPVKLRQKKQVPVKNEDTAHVLEEISNNISNVYAEMDTRIKDVLKKVEELHSELFDRSNNTPPGQNTPPGRTVPERLVSGRFRNKVLQQHLK